jgi:tetratricopeptide (TPR) repeat protein
MRWLIVVVLLVSAGTAAAQGTSEEQAQAQFQKGTQHFNLAEWDEAITAYKEAYRLLPEPLFLYNIAQSYRQKGDCKQARTFYKSYLREAPDADNRAKVEQRIAEMEECIRTAGGDADASDPVPVPDPDPVPVPVPDPDPDPVPVPVPDPDPVADAQPLPDVSVQQEPRRRSGKTKRIIGLATAGAGILLTGTAVYFSLEAREATRMIESECAVQCNADDVAGIDADGRAAQRNAGILYGVGGVTIAAGAAVVAWSFRF